MGLSRIILIVAPHPDDEVLGCGGVMKRYSSEGHNIYVLIITRGTPRLFSNERITMGRKQALQAHTVLGVKETFFFDYPAPELGFGFAGKNLRIDFRAYSHRLGVEIFIYSSPRRYSS